MCSKYVPIKNKNNYLSSEIEIIELLTVYDRFSDHNKMIQNGSDGTHQMVYCVYNLYKRNIIRLEARIKVNRVVPS